MVSLRKAEWLPEFSTIACYNDAEVTEKLGKLTQLEDYHKALRFLEGITKRALSNSALAAIARASNLDEVQECMEQLLLPPIKHSIDHLEITGLENLSAKQPYTFISNHRDIVLDPLLLNLALKQHDFNTAHCAIGDNLLFNEFAEHLAKLNRCFTVMREQVSPKAMLRSMKTQSAYIAYLHQVKSNIWLAQKEGRAKDNRDITNPALLKMLALSRDKSVPATEYLNAMNIVSISFSYEMDPCDVSKAHQLVQTKHNSSFVKHAEEDLNAVMMALSGEKGRVAIRFSKPMHFDNTESFPEMAARIDKNIHSNYQLYPINYGASQLLGLDLPQMEYGATEISLAAEKLAQRLAKETELIRTCVLQAYAQPVAAKARALNITETSDTH